MMKKKKNKPALPKQQAELRRKVKRLEKIERTLLQERFFLRTLIDNLPDAIYAKDLSCRKIFANPADIHNIGLESEADVLGKDDFQFFPKEIAEGFYADDQSVIRTGMPVLNREEFFVDAEGRKRWLATSKLPLKDERGNVTGIIGIGRDITERKNAEEELQREKGLMDVLMESVPDSIYFKDRQCRLVKISRKMQNDLKLNGINEPIGKTDVELFGEEFGRQTLKNDEQLMALGKPVVGLTESRLLENGSLYWTSTTKVPLRDGNGQTVGLVGITREMNEFMRAQSELAYQKQYLESLVEGSPIAIVTLNLEQQIQTCNKAFEIIFGYSEDEAIGKNLDDLIVPENKKEEAQKLTLSSFRQESVHCELTRKRKDGSIVDVEVHAKSIYIDKKQVGVIAQYEDITDRKRAEKEISMLASALMSINECVSITDLEDNILFVNRSFIETYGWSKNELIGQNISIVRSRDSQPEFVRDILRETIKNEWHGELINRKKDGSEFPISLSTTSLLGDDDRPLALIGIASDITERKRAERALRESNEKLQLIFENAFDGINIFEENPDPALRRLVDCNARYAEMAGRSREELLRIGNTQNIAKPLSQDNTRSIEQTVVFRGSFSWIRPDGKDNIIEYSAVPIKLQGKTFTIGIDHDVTERTKADLKIKGQMKIIEEQNLELEKARDLAMEANKTKSAFLASMSHELRTPLNAIIGYSEMIAEDMSDDGETRYRSDLDRIHMAGKNLLELINEVLDLSKIEAGKMELYLEEFQLNTLIEEVVSTVQPLMEKNENAFLINIPQEMPLVLLDHTKVRQILFNLISNASKFTLKGTITLTAATISAVGDAGAKIVLKVSDTGIGLTEEQKAKLFKEFSQADSSTTRKYGGTGLGLAITKHFTEMMHGSIEIESVPNHGTTFTVVLPQVIEDSEDKAVPVNAPVQAALAAVPTNTAVLVVDDDPGVRDLLLRYLSKEGYVVECVASGDEGIKRAKEILPMAIILDVMMPRKDGWAVLQEIKSDPVLKSIPVVMYTMLDEKNFGLAIGASDYLIKPVSREKILQVLEKYKQKTPSEYILVVDDNPDLRTMASRVIQKAGWEVRTAENGKSALAFLENELPSIIFLDIMMPVMDGFEFLTIFQNRDEWKHIPVVVITSKDLVAEERQQLNGIVKKIIQKGDCTPERLLKQISVLIPQLTTQKNSFTGSSNG